MNSRAASLALVPLIVLVPLAGCSASVPERPAVDGRTVDTVLGEVVVPADIDSVVVIEGRRDLDIVLSLGLPLSGYPYEEQGALDLESPLADALEDARQNGAEELFLADEVNVEAIATVAPDLIVSRVDDVQPLLEELTAIAPVLAIGDQDTSTWQDDLRLVAEATGTEERAEELIAGYEERVETISAEYADVLADHAFAPMSYNGESAEARPNRLLSLVLRDVGATPSAAFADVIDGGDGEYSLEQLLQGFGDADAIVALVNDPQTWEQLQADPLYQQLPAVQEGHAVRSDKQTHEGAALTAEHALDVVEQLLATF
ncbi:ABC transporter substrate-binding protein [Microbacterium betulae]|uniref:ABC transporter substrate-binding protein n=1 Tax=Microbacterium betulae TaxID=2981139 RepID=A0AA97I774_9MICO|nr:ABC transporter substrate-binding protein [Microbacterium sp. AB]WOF23312.1 ABC transporter substrate-binding protein [Microbacterium sp. AB]